MRGIFNVLIEIDLDEFFSIVLNVSMIIYVMMDKGSGVLVVVFLDGRVKVKLLFRIGDVREFVWLLFM